MGVSRDRESLSYQILHHTPHSHYNIYSSPKQLLQKSDILQTFKMNNADSHPRVLSLSAGSSATSTPFAATPVSQSRRVSHDFENGATNFASQQEKTHKTLNQSIKKMWKDIKHHAAEHHRGVNAAYHASYGCGTYRPAADN